MSNIFTITPYADMLAGHYWAEPRGALFAKSYDKDFKRKKKRRKMAKDSRRRNRRGYDG